MTPKSVCEIRVANQLGYLGGPTLWDTLGTYLTPIEDSAHLGLQEAAGKPLRVLGIRRVFVLCNVVLQRQVVPWFIYCYFKWPNS